MIGLRHGDVELGAKAIFQPTHDHALVLEGLRVRNVNLEGEKRNRYHGIRGFGNRCLATWFLFFPPEICRTLIHFPRKIGTRWPGTDLTLILRRCVP